MSLHDYILNGPDVVILDDDRDPYVSWQHHLERAGRGGVDLVALTPVPVLAPTAGTMAWVPNDGSAGNSCRFYHDKNSGWKDVFSHLSRYVGRSGQHFEQGEIIAYTGATGGVTPHLHRHLLDPGNIRRNPWDYFTGSSIAGGGGTPIPEPLNLIGPTMRAYATPSGRRGVLGELTYQDLSGEQTSNEAHVWETLPGSDSVAASDGEPIVISDETLDLAIGQIQKRRAQLHTAFKQLDKE